jgi:hypothetical protein
VKIQLYSFSTLALTIREWQLNDLVDLSPAKELPVRNKQEARRASEPVWAIWSKRNLLLMSGIKL